MLRVCGPLRARTSTPSRLHARLAGHRAQAAMELAQQPSAAMAGSREPVELAGWIVEGVSVAGQACWAGVHAVLVEAAETCIMLPQVKVAFDIGRCPQRSVVFRDVFISHGHMDHIGGTPFHVATRAMHKTAPSRVYSIPQCCDAVTRVLTVHSELEREPLLAEVHVLQVGGEVRLSNSHVVRPFETVHTVPSQGYMLVAQKSKLKAEFEGCSRDAIVQAKRAGVPVTEVVEVVEVAFTGDTSIDFVAIPANARVLTARLLILELTFIDDKVDRAGAHERGHMHIDDLVEYAHRFQNEAILLIHFSARHGPQEILDALDARLPPDLRSRCYPFLQGFARR